MANETVDQMARRLKLGEYAIKETQATKLKEGVKHDGGKDPVHLVAPEFIMATSRVLGFGAQKYEEWNWAKGMKWSRVFSALMRHMWAWWAGKGPTANNFVFGDLDDETEFSHLWHACCCLMFLVCYEEWGMEEYDDRYKGANQ